MTTLFWHRRDLRLDDNRGLAAAVAADPTTLGVFCLDPAILTAPDIAPVRVAFLLGALADLARRYRQQGGQLLLLQGNPVELLPRLAHHLRAARVVWNRDVEPYARQRDAAVEQALGGDGVTVHHSWDQLLHDPEAIRSGNGNPYTVYGPFWKNLQGKPKDDPLSAPAAFGVPPIDWTAVETALPSLRRIPQQPLPTLTQLGLTWERDLPFEPGETAAREQLARFCDGAIATYEPGRNFPAEPGTSGLSAALQVGCLGIRRAWQQAETAADLSRSEEGRASIRVWQQELAWREFYQHALWHFPELADGPYRPLWKHFPWENDERRFRAWCEGRTGVPIVDAAMRQLNETGWMHNRCRMIVASFLVKDLIIDWRWGERYFMQRLVDGDLAANNGGWQWSASSGMDPKPLRIFNPATQAKKFDPEAEYIRCWLPELARRSTVELLSGELAPILRGDYPAPIVDHNRQQKHFKALYAQLKADWEG